MTVQQLIEQLQSVVDLDGEDVEVRLALQPSYPLIATILEKVTLVRGVSGEIDGVYIVEATQIGYLPGEVAEAIGWGR